MCEMEAAAGGSLVQTVPVRVVPVFALDSRQTRAKQTLEVDAKDNDEESGGDETTERERIFTSAGEMERMCANKCDVKDGILCKEQTKRVSAHKRQAPKGSTPATSHLLAASSSTCGT